MKKSLIYYGNPVLRKKCQEVEEINDHIRQVCTDLIDTVSAANGAGLAAPQIGCSLRIFVCFYDDQTDQHGDPIISDPELYINPVLSEPSDQESLYFEGCLSIPGISEEFKRPTSIVVQAMDIEGNIFKKTVSGWKARVIMHENDHLNGVLFIDRISNNIRKRLENDLQSIKNTYKNTY